MNKLLLALLLLPATVFANSGAATPQVASTTHSYEITSNFSVNLSTGELWMIGILVFIFVILSETEWEYEHKKKKRK